MTKEQFANLLEIIQKEEHEVRRDGQSEYARDDSNCFANFERVASYLHLTREQVLLTYTLKHIDGIISYVNGHKSQREDVRGRIKDARMYLALLWGMIEDNSRLTISTTVKVDPPATWEYKCREFKCGHKWITSDPPQVAVCPNCTAPFMDS